MHGADTTSVRHEEGGSASLPVHESGTTQVLAEEAGGALKPPPAHPFDYPPLPRPAPWQRPMPPRIPKTPPAPESSGWICPRCQRCWAPSVQQCLECQQTHRPMGA